MAVMVVFWFLSVIGRELEEDWRRDDKTGIVINLDKPGHTAPCDPESLPTERECPVGEAHNGRPRLERGERFTRGDSNGNRLRQTQRDP